MKLYSVFDSFFSDYGSVVTGCEAAVSGLTEMLREKFPLPETGLCIPSDSVLENTPEARMLSPLLFGGLDAQFGCCWGRNAMLNCLEYHRDSEFNLSDTDFILLLALRSQLVNNEIDTSRIKAFMVPKGTMVEIFATTLHYAPCHVDPAQGFRVLAVMSRGSNTQCPEHCGQGHDSCLLWARNKWLVAHPDSFEASAGAVVGIHGENLCVSSLTGGATALNSSRTSK